MTFKNLIPKSWGRKDVSAQGKNEDPFGFLQREMNRVFDTFSQEGWAPLDLWGGRSGGALSPQVDVEETDENILVTAELPGLEEKDVNVTLSGDTLILQGEKKQEKEDKKKNFHRVERSYGSFQRSIALPAEVQGDQVEAVFKKGVLTVTLPKTPQAQSQRKKIIVKHG